MGQIMITIPLELGEIDPSNCFVQYQLTKIVSSLGHAFHQQK